jgi:hypothetical protein
VFLVGLLHPRFHTKIHTVLCFADDDDEKEMFAFEVVPKNDHKSHCLAHMSNEKQCIFGFAVESLWCVML